MYSDAVGRQKKGEGSHVKQFVVLTLILFIFWIILSGHIDVKHLTIGFLTSVAVAAVTRPLLVFPSATGNGKFFYAFDFPYIKYLLYWPWLLWQIVKANIEIALVVLNPRMPIDPQIIAFHKEMSNPLAHVTLANSITLTPGTVTVDVENGLYIVHALTENAAKGLVPEEGEGEMPMRVAAVFNEGGEREKDEY